MERIAIESKNESLRTQIAIRCAKVAVLLSSLKSSANYPLHSTNHYQVPRKEVVMRTEMENLKRELVKERLKNKKMRLCSFEEFVLQITLLLSLWTFALLIAFNVL